MKRDKYIKIRVNANEISQIQKVQGYSTKAREYLLNLKPEQKPEK